MLLGAVMALAMAACGSAPSTSNDPLVLSVFAGASLGDVVAAAAPVYRTASGIAIQAATDSSTSLRIQIEQGAQADVFLSADTRNPEALLEAGLVDGALVPFARNRLAIIVPSDNPAGIRTYADLVRPGIKIVAAGANVPISAYAAQLVDEFAAMAGTQPGFAVAYAANVVSREDNVRAVVAKIALGEGDAAIVYASDAFAFSAVTVIPMPPSIDVLAVYAGVVPKTAHQPAAGHDFLDWFTGSAGQEILAAFGFSAPP